MRRQTLDLIGVKHRAGLQERDHPVVAAFLCLCEGRGVENGLGLRALDDLSAQGLSGFVGQPVRRAETALLRSNPKVEGIDAAIGLAGRAELAGESPVALPLFSPRTDALFQSGDDAICENFILNRHSGLHQLSDEGQCKAFGLHVKLTCCG